MAMIEGYNLRGEVVEIYRDFEDFRNYWKYTSTEKLEEILESHVDVLASSGDRVKYYYIEEAPKEKPNAFDKEFNITNDPINILLESGTYGCDTKKYFAVRNAYLLEKMCDNARQEAIDDDAAHQEALDNASEEGLYVDQYDDQYIAERMKNYYEKGSDFDIDKEPNMPLQGLGGEDGGEYDEKGNSSHYQSQFMEFVRDQERKYGTVVAMIVCQSNVDKYNQRVGRKEGVPVEKDLTKRDWYFKAMTHFKKKVEAVEAGSLVPLEDRNRYVPLAEEVMDLLRIDIDQNGWAAKYTPLSTAIEK
jgi:hypothetical protein